MTRVGDQSSAWTQYWSRATVDNAKKHELGQALDHTAGDYFRSRGVASGDRIYIINWWKGSLILLGRLDVGQIVDQSQAEQILGKALWKADDHIVAKPGSGKPLRERELPGSQLHKVEFVAADGTVVGVKYKRGGAEVEPQTFRYPVREIPASTVRLFDRLLR